LKVRLASLALQIAPRLTRALYLRMRASAWPRRTAAAQAG